MEYHIKRRKDNRRKCLEYLGGQCSLCGETADYKLQFHHKDPRLKSFTISRYLNGSMKKLIPELDKCIILCISCHRKTHISENQACAVHGEKLNSYCKDCISFRKTSYRRKMKLALIEILGEKCAYCKNVTFPENYDFHHLEKESKKYNIAFLIERCNWKTAIEEIKKMQFSVRSLSYSYRKKEHTCNHEASKYFRKSAERN
jgi:hypothetical protein